MYRDAAIRLSCSRVFNQYLSGVAKPLLQHGKHQAFWEMLKVEALTLISIAEDAINGASLSDCEAFFSETAVEVVAPTVVAPAEEDDLFADLA